MSRYAENMNVSVNRSRDEIERTLKRYSASAFSYTWYGSAAKIEFAISNRVIQLILPLPSRAEFELSSTGRPRTESAVENDWEQACRQRWRALALLVKAKLEAVESGISSVEEEFLANVRTGDGTFYQHAKSFLEEHYLTGEVPPINDRRLNPAWP